ncbi:DNA polymerase III subunit beta family protein [Burkholderia pseudomallei]|uniref:DNA polymerase III subunit beta family protein n=1 Tax=Burkholderia pseudomallei TaxID=28450 RepID=UPI00015F7C8D|nr:DNA polymerase III subunit beta [Burkholderia pseudomallei]AJX62036.1 DNA polymerase III beta subunit, central domain protein [Burkholderia pseudomallei Pasteur 52237]EDO95245.1 DNA polymerase III subunit beta [Burkholderia pseudomallei Pasteur 52237]MWA16530.1 DNA polymerase III subunit beta [Burkholderia pseudomallei]VBQ81302.1 DNA polymerase III subunit beta [Burkholderia pseudomallei]
MKINATASALKAVQLIAPRDDIRYYLNGVMVEAREKETRLVATDGHRLVVYRIECNNEVPAGESISIIVPNAVIDRLKLSKDAPDAVTFESADAGRMFFSHDDIRVTFTPVDANFPNYRKVIPETVSGKPGHYKPAYLFDFQKIGAALKRKRSTRDILPILYQNGETSAAIVQLEGDDAFIGVVMPIRTETLGKPLSLGWARA